MAIHRMEVVGKSYIDVEADSKEEALEKVEICYSIEDVKWGKFVQVKWIEELEA